MPQKVVVTKDFVEFDGWVFLLSNVTKSFLAWLQQLLLRWAELDCSEQTKQWILGIHDAIMDVLVANH